MAGRPDSATREYVNGEPDPKYTEQLATIKAELSVAILGNDGTVDAARAVAVLQERMWNQQALVSLDCGYFDDAAKASREATRHGELAVKLSRSTLADRVTELEQQVGLARSAGAGIRAEANKRRAAANAS